MSTSHPSDARAPEVRRDRRGRRIGRNWWRERNVDSLRAADHAWWLGREQVAIGYATEEAEYDQTYPRPTLKAFLISNRGQQLEERAA